MSEEKRTISVKRALTRTKTIVAQLDVISDKIRNHGAISSKVKSTLVDTRLPLSENHKQAEAEMQSLYQQHRDLIAEYTKLKKAIAISNLTETITVGGKTMTIFEALLMENSVRSYISRLVTSFRNVARTAENEVAGYNATTQKKAELTAAELEIMQADVLYLVPRKDIEETERFLQEFAVELHGLIDESNVLTILEID